MMGIFALLMLLLVCLCIAGSTMGFARYFGTVAVSRLQGRSGETNYKRWKSGINVAQVAASVVRNPNSLGQDVIRAVFSVYSKRWIVTLTAQQRADWETYALTQPGKHAVGQGVRELVGSNGGIMSGINAYCLTNAWLISAGIAAVDDPPLVAPAPANITDLAATSVGGTVTVTWTAPLVEAGAQIRIWMASMQGTFHKQIVATEDVLLGTADVTAVNAAMGKAIQLSSLVGQFIYIQVDIVNPTGGKSAGSNTVEHLIA